MKKIGIKVKVTEKVISQWQEWHRQKIARIIKRNHKEKKTILGRQSRLNNARYASEMWFESKLIKAGFEKVKVGLSRRRIRYERNGPVPPFYVDFIFQGYGIGIEIDGRHHYEPDQTKYDDFRTKQIKRYGIKIFRILYGDETNANLMASSLTEWKESIVKIGLPHIDLDKERFELAQRELIKILHKNGWNEVEPIRLPEPVKEKPIKKVFKPQIVIRRTVCN